MKYDVREIEKKWQQFWRENHTGHARPTGDGRKYYCLDMFPYPSGSGLHVGHWRGYILSDVYARVKWLEGYNVLHPMGWDAFGLPAENDAIKKGIQPKIGTAKNIAVFKKQLEDTGALYDWSKEINTTDPNYYKWTQWIFIQMYKAGLAYQSDTPINWCPSCMTGLANEEVVHGACERCGTTVEKKKIRQWILKITDYAEKLLEGLDRLEWPERVKSMQRNWIGKSHGAKIVFKTKTVEGESLDLPVFTTRADTLYGVTFLAVAADHDLLSRIVAPKNYKAIEDFCALVRKSRESATTAPEKSGIFTGSYALHPITQQEIPIYATNYVLKDYGTGVVMGVPAHDARDFEFARAFDLPMIRVIESGEAEVALDGTPLAAYEGDGVIINSGIFDGKQSTDAKKEIVDYLIERNYASSVVFYKLHDWIFSRQRYWGEPIPLVHCAKCGVVPVPESDLPVVLPEVEKYQPTGTGESPLADIADWVNTKCPTCHGPAKRETNTMPQWAGSSWYFLRYPDAQLADAAFDKKDLEYWLPVDLYVGGIEHAILHLLYARFYTKVLYDLGYLNFDEPFVRLFNQGMVCKLSEKSGLVEKMSKSKGNVVNPDDIVKDYGSDALRLYILFMGPPELDCEWQDTGLEGCKRFLNRFWHFFAGQQALLAGNALITEDVKVIKRVHRLLKDVQERLALLRPNTIVSAFMEWLNEATAESMQLNRDSAEKILVAFSILAPHISSELLSVLLNKNLTDCAWPVYDPQLAAVDEVVIAVQVNGKLRGTLTVAAGLDDQELQIRARELVVSWIGQNKIIKTVHVPLRLINFVIQAKEL